MKSYMIYAGAWLHGRADVLREAVALVEDGDPPSGLGRIHPDALDSVRIEEHGPAGLIRALSYGEARAETELTPHTEGALPE